MVLAFILGLSQGKEFINKEEMVTRSRPTQLITYNTLLEPCQSPAHCSVWPKVVAQSSVVPRLPSAELLINPKWGITLNPFTGSESPLEQSLCTKYTELLWGIFWCMAQAFFGHPKDPSLSCLLLQISQPFCTFTCSLISFLPSQNWQGLHPFFPDYCQYERCPKYQVKAGCQTFYICWRKGTAQLFPTSIKCVVHIQTDHSIFLRQFISLVLFSCSFPQQGSQSYLINRDAMTSSQIILNTTQDTLPNKLYNYCEEGNQHSWKFTVSCSLSCCRNCFHFFSRVCFFCPALPSKLFFCLNACDHVQEMYISRHRNIKCTHSELAWERRSTQLIFSHCTGWSGSAEPLIYTPFLFWYC